MIKKEEAYLRSTEWGHKGHLKVNQKNTFLLLFKGLLKA